MTIYPSARDIYWHSITAGVGKEIVEQFAWVEEAVLGYDRGVATKAIDECAGQLVGFARAIRREAVAKDCILRGNGVDFPAEQDMGNWVGSGEAEILAQAEALKNALFPATATAVAAPGMADDGTANAAKAFQVALSFAGEQRDYLRRNHLEHQHDGATILV